MKKIEVKEIKTKRLCICLTLSVVGSRTNVDHDEVPVRHFGVILPWDEWHKIKEVLLNGEYASEIQWVIRPKIRFKGEVGEQATMFIKDPSENVLEFKSFQNTHQIFASS